MSINFSAETDVNNASTRLLSIATWKTQHRQIHDTFVSQSGSTSPFPSSIVPTMHPGDTSSAEVDRVASEMAASYNAHDWERYATFLAPSFVHHWSPRPGKPLGRAEYLLRTLEHWDSSPNYKIQVLDQTVLDADPKVDFNLISVLQTCTQVGNVDRGDVARDCVRTLRFEKIEGRWLCFSIQSANGCHYF